MIDYGEDWADKRKIRLEMDGGLCVHCGRPAVEVHHVAYVRVAGDRLRNDPELDLRSLCADCHDHETRKSRATRPLR